MTLVSGESDFHLPLPVLRNRRVDNLEPLRHSSVIIYLQKMLKLVSSLVWVFADSLAQDDSPFVQEDVALHRFKTQLPQPVAFSFSPHTEAALEEQSAQFGQTSL